MAKKLKPIPNFKTIQEEANFWDTHDSANYTWEETKVEFAKPLKHTFVSSNLTAGLSIDLVPKVL